MTNPTITLAVQLYEQAHVLDEAGLDSGPTHDHAKALLAPKCGAEFHDHRTGEAFVCVRPKYGWFPGLHRTRAGQWFGRYPLLGGAWTGKKPAPK